MKALQNRIETDVSRLDCSRQPITFVRRDDSKRPILGGGRPSLGAREAHELTPS